MGFTAIIDDSDYGCVSKYRWSVKIGGTGIKYGHRVDKNNKSIYLHRYIMKAKKGQTVDHINRNGLDNRKANLRFCTTAENIMNSKMFKHNTSGYKGVTWDKFRNKWASQIQFSQKHIYLGRHESLEDAVRSRKQAEKQFFPNI